MLSMQLKMGQEYIIIDVPKAEGFFFIDFLVLFLAYVWNGLKASW